MLRTWPFGVKPCASITIIPTHGEEVPVPRSGLHCIVALACLLILPPVAAAASQDLEYNAGVTIGASALWLATAFPLKTALAPDSCRWCDRGKDGTDKLNGLDASMRERFRLPQPGSAAQISDALLVLGVPATSVASIWVAAKNDGRENETGENALLILEAVTVSAALNQVVKLTSGRQRPYAHYAAAGAAPTSEDNLSFYSGHSTVTFTTSVAAGTIASMRGYGGANWVWVPGAVLATATSYLRLGCDRHYFTDVLAGAVIGAGVGIAVPRLLHGGDDDAAGPSAPALRTKPVLSFRWAW